MGVPKEWNEHASGTPRLITHLRPVTEYYVNDTYLVLLLRLGARLDRVHSAVSYRQDRFMASTMAVGVDRRRAHRKGSSLEKAAKNSINSLFGKQLEDPRGRKRVRFILTNEQLTRARRNPTLESLTLLSSELEGGASAIAVFAPAEVELSSPMHVGAAILDGAKVWQQTAFYAIKRALRTPRGEAWGRNRVRLGAQDTDSLIMHWDVPESEAWRLLAQHPFVRRNWDGTNLPPTHPLHTEDRRNIPGPFKQEVAPPNVIERAIALRAKDHIEEIRHADGSLSESGALKGVSSYLREHVYGFEAHKKVLEEDGMLRDGSWSIQQYEFGNHVLYTERCGISAHDEKRIRKGRFDSTPYGFVEPS